MWDETFRAVIGQFAVRRGMPLAAALAGLIAFGATGSAAAAPLKLPGCNALVAWSKTTEGKHGTVNVTPRLTIPKAFAEPQFSAVFGIPVLQWTRNEFKNVKPAFDKCYQEARKKRDRAAVQALVVAHRTLTRGIPRVINTLKKTKDAAEATTKKIEGLPDSAELDNALAVLIKADPAAPDMNGLRGLPRNITRPVGYFARLLPNLAAAEREALFKDLAARRTKIEAGMTDTAEKAVASALASADGVMSLLEARQEMDKLADATVTGPVDQKIDQRVKEIDDGLSQAKPAVWVPPSCLAMYQWGAAPDAIQGVAVGRSGGVLKSLSDERAVPVFKLSVANWTDGDLAVFSRLRVYCKRKAYLLRQKKANGGTLTADESALLKAHNQSSRVSRWLELKNDNESLVPNARKVLVTYRKAVADLHAAEAKMAALPETAESLNTLKQYQSSQALGVVGRDEFNRYSKIYKDKFNAISTHVTKAAIDGLAGIQVASLGDLKKFPAYAAKVRSTIPNQVGVGNFDTAYARAMHAASKKLLPKFQDKLNDMPEGPAGIAPAVNAVGKMTGLVNVHDRLTQAGLQPLQAAAQKRVSTIIKSMRDGYCKDTLSDLGADDDADEPLWDGKKGMTLGEWICGLTETGAVFSDYSGSGMFSSTTTVKVTLPGNTLQTFSLHEAEVLPDKKMLVGFELEGANRTQKLTADQWAGFAQAAKSHMIGGRDACKRVVDLTKTKSVDEVSGADKLFLMQCMMQFGGGIKALAGMNHQG